MNNYETIMIIRPDLGEEKLEEEINKYDELIRENGKVLMLEVWGERKLAYPIVIKKQEFNKGYYVMFKYMSESSFTDILTKEYEKDKNILKKIIVKN